MYEENDRLLVRVAGLAAVTLLSLALSFALPASLLPEASAATWTVDTTTRTETDVRAMWTQLQPTYTGTQYAVVPSTCFPYTPGDASVGFRSDGVKMINFGRYLAGLPYDVTLSATHNSNGQYGAVLLTTSPTLTHYPAQPADMPADFYAIGYAATTRSNIGAGYSDAETFEKNCLADASASNIVMVGHRRWLLNPPMKYTGIGFAGNRITTYAFDTSRSDAVDYPTINWPSAGLFPVEFMSALTPWSVTLNPARYDYDATRAGHTVTLRRVSDGRTWTFDDKDTNTAGEYFNADFGGYGIANAFIFRPDPASISYAPGDEFDVTLSGGIYLEGTKTPTTVTYRTRFMTLAGAAPPVVPVTPTSPLMSVYRFYNLKNGSHFYTASAAERDSVIASFATTYQYEGVAYVIDTADAANSAPLYRFYNKSNGSHFYTVSAAERDRVIQTLATVYSYEGPAYNVAVTSAGTAPLYRFYNKSNGSHFFTISATERDRICNTLSAVYAYEGVAFYVAQ